MRDPGTRLAGVELYFDDLPAATEFYTRVLGLQVTESQPAHHATLATGTAFLCLERKGVENYPSVDKAVVFLEVADLDAAVRRIGRERFLRVENGDGQRWAVLRDPEGHTVLLLEVAASK